MSLDSLYYSSGFNSYIVDVAEMDTIMASLNGAYNISGWTAITDPLVKENVILAATNDMNKFEFTGQLNQGVISSSDMKFPRKGVAYTNGVAIAETDFPSFVLKYIAIRILERLANVSNGAYNDGRIKRQKLGDLEQEFFSPAESRVSKNTLRRNASFEEIKPYVTNSSANMRYLVRA